MRKQIPLFKVFMSDAAINLSTETLLSGYVGEGPKVIEFENKLKDRFTRNSNGYYDVITCNSATSAEHLIYHYLKQPRKLINYFPWGSTELNWKGFDVNKHHVLTTPLTCTATNFPILLNGMKLKWVDVNPFTMNMDLGDLENKIDENTRIITVVHWGGYPIDLYKLQSIVTAAKKRYGNDILIIEDCAHSFGSTYDGIPLGFHGNIGTFSTQAIKHLTTVDGGFISSPYKDLTDKSKLLRWYGIDRNTPRTDFRCEQDIPEIGFKFHMNDVNASIGLGNLKYIDDLVNTHKQNADYYSTYIDKSVLKDVIQFKHEYLNIEIDPAYWLYTILVEDRPNFMKKMESAGIMTSRVHERNDKHSSLTEFKTELPLLESFIDNMVCIPVGWWVQPEDREYIIQTINSGW